MHRLAPTLVAEMGGAYPELKRAEPVIVETLRQEEERFRRTLGRGMSLLDEATAGLQPGQAMLSGDTAFKLYDTYGFPLDLTQDALRAKGLEVDLEGFDTAMERQRAGGARTGPDRATRRRAATGWPLRARLGATAFEGYETVEVTARGVALAEGRRGVGGGRGRRHCAGGVRPHPLLCRERRPGL